MNLVARQIYGKKPALVGWNTYIGGVSATLSTAALLASKLGISVGNISNFTIVGSDIKCNIIGSYAIPSPAFDANSYPTLGTSYYTDSNNLVSSIGNSAFRNAPIKGVVKFNGALSVGSDAFYNNSGISNLEPTTISLANATSVSDNAFFGISKCFSYYIPRATTLGSTAASNNVFFECSPFTKIYAHPSLATNNGGASDGDLAYAISRGATVRYVSNFTIPNPVTNLAAGTIYNTAIQLNFTAPTGSTNAIDYYNCYADGVFKNRIVSSGEYIVGLTASTSYSLTITAVDIFMNESIVSNSVTQSTNTTSAVPTTGLVSYYKLDETSGTTANDSYGTQHLTNTNVAVNQSGKIGTSYLSNVTSNKLTGACTPITGAFTINIWLYRTADTPTAYCNVVSQGDYATGFGIWIAGAGNLGWFINGNYDNHSLLTVAELNKWTMATLVYDGSFVYFYINAVLRRKIANTTNPNTVSTRTFAARGASTYLGRFDEAAIYNAAKMQNEIDRHYNLGTGITI